MRLFVALGVPSAVRKAFAALIESLRAISPQVRWVRPENLHVTLKFIGEIPEAKLAAIRSELSNVRSHHSVVIDFRGLGFSRAKNILVLSGLAPRRRRI
jgi:2'-5' RNA ligase